MDIDGRIRIWQNRQPIPGKEIKASLVQPNKVEIDFIATVVFKTKTILVLDILSSEDHQILIPGQRMDISRKSKSLR